MSKINFEEIFILSLRSGELLQWQLANNINLLEFADKKTLLAVDVLLALIPKSKRREMLGDIDANRIMDLLKKQRPDLFLILEKHPNGKIWVGQQIINLKKRFL